MISDLPTTGSTSYRMQKKELEAHFGKDLNSLVFPMLAQIYFDEDDLVRARKVCEVGLGRHPGYASGCFMLAKICLREDCFAEAERLLITTLNQDSNHIIAAELLVAVQERLGRRPAILEKSYRRLLKANPLSRDAQNRLRRIEAEKELIRKVRDELRQRHKLPTRAADTRQPLPDLAQAGREHPDVLQPLVEDILQPEGAEMPIHFTPAETVTGESAGKPDGPPESEWEQNIRQVAADIKGASTAPETESEVAGKPAEITAEGTFSVMDQLISTERDRLKEQADDEPEPTKSGTEPEQTGQPVSEPDVAAGTATEAAMEDFVHAVENAEPLESAEELDEDLTEAETVVLSTDGAMRAFDETEAEPDAESPAEPDTETVVISADGGLAPLAAPEEVEPDDTQAETEPAREEPAEEVTEEVTLNVDPRLATFTLATIYKVQGLYQEALKVLEMLEAKNADPERITDERDAIAKAREQAEANHSAGSSGQ